ncbi:DUF4328 domain-containing protein [Streptomyces vietnamensis]|uniref:DUF4328 domain-containing protein n=1 Tax=Streptomyces vietnamensis TaxID=362257 RepID=A0A0B5I2W7_9ACTN|nr:DUF4328 domain-containing protein [Streptomyces vietnamensis]AJF66916.1 hypothetical protein SVTN_23585 [Streptomyces vietnamensis]
MRMLKNPIGLSRAVVVLLLGNVFFDVLLGGIEGHDLVADDPYYSDVAVGPVDGAYATAGLVYLATIVVFIIWFHRLRNNAEVWASDLQSRTPGYAIGGWFIPILNFWVPRVIAADIWRASRWEPYAADAKGELTLLNSWWVCFVASGVADSISRQFYKNAETVEAYDTATLWSLAGYGLDIAAAFLAILVVRRLTSMQHAKATGMIPAAQ